MVQRRCMICSKPVASRGHASRSKRSNQQTSHNALQMHLWQLIDRRCSSSSRHCLHNRPILTPWSSNWHLKSWTLDWDKPFLTHPLWGPGFLQRIKFIGLKSRTKMATLSFEDPWNWAWGYYWQMSATLRAQAKDSLSQLESVCQGLGRCTRWWQGPSMIGLIAMRKEAVWGSRCYLCALGCGAARPDRASVRTVTFITLSLIKSFINNFINNFNKFILK